MQFKFAAIAVDAVVAYSFMTDSTWVFAWTLQEVLYHRSWLLSFLHLNSTSSSPWLLSISRASWHIPLGSQQWWQDHLQPETCVTRSPAQWWRGRDWVGIPGGPQPSSKTLGWNTHQHETGFDMSAEGFCKCHKYTKLCVLPHIAWNTKNITEPYDEKT